MWKRFAIFESKLNSKPLKVDRKRHIIFGVKIIGFESQNGRRYTPEALKEAIRLYEGVKVNIDHPENPDDSRSAYDRIGKLTNVRFREGQGLFGDLWLNPGHEIAESVFNAAEEMPDLYGLSHNAQGEGDKDDEGIFIIHKITEVRHVDLVADPATTLSLSESKMRPADLFEEDEKKDEKEETKEEYKEEDSKEEEGKDDLAAKVLDALKEEEMSDEDKAKAILDMVKEALSEENETQEAEEEPKSEEAEAQEEEDSKEEDDSKADAKESKLAKANKALAQLQEEVKRIKHETFVRRLCEASKLPVSKQLLEDLMQLNKASAERHIKRLGLAYQQTKPRTGVPVAESVSRKIPAGAELYNWLRN
jgi:hypothetical protein